MKPRWPWQAAPQIRFAGIADLPEILQLCALDPVAHVLAEVRIRHALGANKLAPGELLRYPDTGPIEAACWVGANVVPINATNNSEAITAFAHQLRNHPGNYASVVGESQAVLALWQVLESSGMRAREVRTSQPSMVLDVAASGNIDRAVRRATLADYPSLLPACVAMFREEIGYSPLSDDGAYQARVRHLISQGRMFVKRIGEPAGPGQGELIFKAEIGALTAQVAQVQGVWTHPDHRGHGYASAGMARLVELTLGHVAPLVSLYVNDYNRAALRVYQKVGFRQVGEYATVLL